MTVYNAGMHTRRSPTDSDIYQMLYWYNWFSWWWARGCSKHVENWNKHMRKRNCASSLLRIRISWFLSHLQNVAPVFLYIIYHKTFQALKLYKYNAVYQVYIIENFPSKLVRQGLTSIQLQSITTIFMKNLFFFFQFTQFCSELCYRYSKCCKRKKKITCNC